VTAVIISAKDSLICCNIHHKKIVANISLQALTELFSSLNGVCVLGGNVSKKKEDGFTYWTAEPKQTLEFRAEQKNRFEKLQTALDKYKPAKPGTDELPKGMFCGGWIGYLGYELGRYIEQLPERTVDDLKMPLIRLCFYDKIICYDHKEEAFWLIALEHKDDIEGPDEKLVSLERLLFKAKDVSVLLPPLGDIEDIDFNEIGSNMEKSYYLEAVERIKKYIYDGQVYQVNFSQRFEREYNRRPIDLFHWQNSYNPSGYAAYIDARDFAIVSASPEMFITIQDGAISTKPIKGTRPRVAKNPTANKWNFDELVKSEKEQAELNMIIDLERNDLARICKPGTRQVIQPRIIESYPTVFHAAATVAGELKNEVTFCDILKAMFPGGSITGAPKISAMEIIDETEPTARGVYTGSIGFIGIDGNVSLNIAIRTVIIKDNVGYVQTGGGIVADSDPEAEWQETLTKARALLAGIESLKKDD
jgi:para-aminobenzoate synthetase component 1